MDRRRKATLHRDKAVRLAEAWGVAAAQARYSDDGHWYAVLERFPAALFDAHGYLLFATEAEYRGSPHLRIGRQISVPRPGISAVPGYVRAAEPGAPPTLDVDVHDADAHAAAADEGRRRLVLHLQRERNRALVRRKKRRAPSLACEVCGFSFARAYGEAAADYCEVHHLVPLADADDGARTRPEDLAVVCANCHRVIHLRNPPYTLDEVCGMLDAEGTPAGADGLVPSPVAVAPDAPGERSRA